jgi:prophage DNA circulation protein
MTGHARLLEHTLTSATDYAATAQTALTTTLDQWKNGVTSVTDQFRSFPTVGNLPQVDVTDAVERQIALIQQIVDLNHSYARQLAEVANTLTGVTRSQLESVGTVVREQVTAISQAVRTGVDTTEEAVREAATEVAKVTRAKRTEATDLATDLVSARYENLSKTELVEQAAQRGLPKSGTVDELVVRLVEADTK